MLNNPKKVPSPGSATLNEALNLIAGLGSGDKNLKSMLEGMKEVQAYNEKIILEATMVVSEGNKTLDILHATRAALEVAREDMAQQRREDAGRTEMDRYDLEKMKTDFSDMKNAKENAYNERHGHLVDQEADLVRDRDLVTADEQQVQKKKKDLVDREAVVYEQEGNLYKINEYIKTLLQ